MLTKQTETQEKIILKNQSISKCGAISVKFAEWEENRGDVFEGMMSKMCSVLLKTIKPHIQEAQPISSTRIMK